MATTMTCNFCGATVIGTVSEVLAWNEQHDQFCQRRTLNDDAATDVHREVEDGR